ncbi:MAG: hypothetical protein IKU28_08100 [Erysipelotrichaceae bacterium]|nr:hypothetical protein [Erysipelotrichaceae bacterium]
MRKLILIACVLFLCAGCSVKKNIIQDLNLSPNDMMSYETMNEPSDRFYELTLKEALRLFEEEGSGILLISRSTCSHCLNAVPVLAEVADKHDLTIYYVDCGKGLESEDLEKLEIYAKDVLGARGVMVPIVFSIVDGKALGKHIGTVSDEDGLLTDEQWDKTVQTYERLLEDWIK